MIVQIVVLALIFSVFLALYIWTRRSESSIDYEHPGLTDEEANALRLGIALTVNQNNLW